MTIAARLEQFPASDRRSAERRKLRLGSILEGTGEDVAIHDISTTGMLIETSAELAAFDALEIDLPYTGVTRALIIWNSGLYYGCAFDKPISKASVSAALLRSAPGAEPDMASAQPPPDRKSRELRSPARVELDNWGDESAYEEKWSLGASARFILASAIMLWALIIGAVIGMIKLFEGLWS